MLYQQSFPVDVDFLWIHVLLASLAAVVPVLTMDALAPNFLRRIPEKIHCFYVGYSSFYVYVKCSKEQRTLLVQWLNEHMYACLESRGDVTVFSSTLVISTYILVQGLEYIGVRDVILCSYGAKWPIDDFAARVKPHIKAHPYNILDVGFSYDDSSGRITLGALVGTPLGERLVTEHYKMLGSLGISNDQHYGGFRVCRNNEDDSRVLLRGYASGFAHRLKAVASGLNFRKVVQAPLQTYYTNNNNDNYYKLLLF